MVPIFGTLLYRYAIPLLDILYFWPTNVDPALARAVLARNFSAISPGVILQFKTAFKPHGLLSSRTGQPFATKDALGNVKQPVLVIVGDRDKMCPAQVRHSCVTAAGSMPVVLSTAPTPCI